MKTIILSVLLYLQFSNVVAQQTGAYNDAMRTGTGLLDSAHTSQQYLRAANLFERIASQAPKEWLPAYYTGYCTMIESILGSGTKAEKDAGYDRSLVFAQKADKLKPDNSEIQALLSYITFMKMSIDPQGRASSMIPEAQGLVQNAIHLDSENPRAYLVRGQILYYTPEAFGGGKAVAKPVLSLAMEKYAASHSEPLQPIWGKARCEELLKTCN